MDYKVTITVQQDPVYYLQKDEKGQVFASKNNEYLPERIDKTKYEFLGLPGAIFVSFEKKHPKAGDKRVIFGKYFDCTMVCKRGFRKYECLWTSSQIRGTEGIEEFKKRILGGVR